MFIKRVQIDDGFLDGLDVTFEPGLNVIIGARGTGKTSLIELIRFGLGAPFRTPEAQRRAEEHLASILNDGQVTVTLERDDGVLVTVSRSRHDPSPRATDEISVPIVFAQTEIESVGLHQDGRRALLDEFIADLTGVQKELGPIQSELEMLTHAIAVASRELQTGEEQLSAIPEVDRQLIVLTTEESGHVAGSVKIAGKKQQLDAITTQLTAISIASTYLERSAALVRDRNAKLMEWCRDDASLEPWPVQGVADPLVDERLAYEQLLQRVTGTTQQLEVLGQRIRRAADENGRRRLELETKSREIRKELEELQRGVGDLMRQIGALRERKGQLSALSVSVAQKRATIEQNRARRERALEALEHNREQRYVLRDAIATRLSGRLGPQLRVQVQREAGLTSYATLLAAQLKGSGLRTGDLVQTITERVSPSELVELAERADVETLVRVSGISRERAAKVITHLREQSLGPLLAASIEDEVMFHLLDGVEYKDIDRLSTGQRCTVVLPLVLEHSERILILDQPEDHIDNAFIVDTLIRVLLERGKSQVISSSHNANIPVLGNASRVVELVSDGRRGFVQVAGGLEDRPVVEAITKVMEGGREAFAARARFYGVVKPSL